MHSKSDFLDDLGVYVAFYHTIQLTWVEPGASPARDATRRFADRRRGLGGLPSWALEM